MEFENFEAVWQRVTAADDVPPPDKREMPAADAQRICIVKRGEKSRAVRFIAGTRE